MTAEQFLDAVWMITGTAPAKADAPVHPPCEAIAPEHRFVRAALVKSDELMRSLGRPNREQVVTTRSDVLTTLEALDLSNGQVFNDTLARGAAGLLEVEAEGDRRRAGRSRSTYGPGAPSLGRRAGRGPRAGRLAPDPGGPGRPALGGVRTPRVPTDPVRRPKPMAHDPSPARTGAAATSSAP